MNSTDGLGEDRHQFRIYSGEADMLVNMMMTSRFRNENLPFHTDEF